MTKQENAKRYYQKHKEEIKAKVKKRYAENSEKIKTYQKKYNKENPEKVAKRKHDYYESNKEKYLNDCKKYRELNADTIKPKKVEEGRKRRLRCKKQIVENYTKGKNCCQCCGYDEIKALVVDHIFGRGSEHQRHIKGNHMYEWIVRNYYPRGFQILCYNCNVIKGTHPLCLCSKSYK